MTMETVICAVCGESVPLDGDYAHIEIEKKRINDRDDREDYYLHTECRLETVRDWHEPA